MAKRDRKRAIVHGYQLFHNENIRREQDLQEMLEEGIIQEEEDREIAFQDQDHKLRITIHLKLFGFDSGSESESELDVDTISDSEYDPKDFEEEFPYMFFITGENPLGIVDKHLGSQKRKEAILYARSKVVNVVGVLTSEAEADKMRRRESDVVFYEVLTGSRRKH